MLCCAAQGRAKLLLSQKDALALAFPPGQEVVKKTAYLDAQQIQSAQRLGKARIEARVWTYYIGKSSGRVTGYAYFDRIIVRTMPATIIVALDKKGDIRFIEILTFDEPVDYLPRTRWLNQFKGKNIKTDLRLRGDIRNVTGATLTAETLTQSARRISALHKILHPSVKFENK